LARTIQRPRRHKGFVLKTGRDGLISIFCASGEPLAAAVKFVEMDTARSFLNRWLAAREKERKRLPKRTFPVKLRK